MVEDSVCIVNPRTGTGLRLQPVRDLESFTGEGCQSDTFDSGLGSGAPQMLNIGRSRESTLWEQQTTGFIARLDSVDPFKFLGQNLVHGREKLIR
jgi:hypothetical protein